jgi:hypothetical protein
LSELASKCDPLDLLMAELASSSCRGNGAWFIFTKINLNWIKDLNTGPDTLELKEEIQRKYLENAGICIDNGFLNRTLYSSENNSKN